MNGAHTKINAAVAQMDWAIRLLLDHQAYLPAATLAGAAEALIVGLSAREPVVLQLEAGERSEAELREVAIQHIARALTLLVRHDRSLPSEGPRFLAWLAKRQEAAGGA